MMSEVEVKMIEVRNERGCFKNDWGGREEPGPGWHTPREGVGDRLHMPEISIVLIS